MGLEQSLCTINVKEGSRMRFLFQIGLCHTSGVSASFDTIGEQCVVSVVKISAQMYKQLVLLAGSGTCNFCQREIYRDCKC